MALVNGYCTREEVKRRLSSDEVNMSTKWDDVIDEIIGAVSRAFDRDLAQKRGARGAFAIVGSGTASPRTYSRRGSRTSYLPIDDCTEVVLVSATGATDLGIAGWTVDTAAFGTIVGLYRTLGAWPGGAGVCTVTAKWGMFTTCPEDVRDQAIVESARSFQGARAGYDDKIGVTPFGTVQISKAFADSTRRMLADYGFGGGFMRAGG